jgi:hypothetical protein
MLRSADGEEVRPELAGDGTGDERLSAAGRPVQEQAACGGLAEGLGELRVTHGSEKGELQALLDLLHAAHVGQPDAGRLDVLDDR